MSLSFQDLQAAVDTGNGALKVDAGTLQSSSITSLLSDFFEGSLLMQPAQPATKGTIKLGEQSLDTVVVVGTLASQFLKLSKLECSAQFYLLDDAAQVRIVFTLPDPWKLSSSFPSLLGSDADKVELRRCSLQVDSSRSDRLGAAFDTLFPATDIATPGLSFQNGLTLTTQLRLASVETTLPETIGAPTGLLDLQGPVEVVIGLDKQPRPRMRLSVTTALADFEAGNLGLELGYQFLTAPVAQDGGSFTQQIRQRLTTVAYTKDTRKLRFPLAITFAPNSLREKFTVGLDTQDTAAVSFQTLAGMIPGGIGDMITTVPGFPSLDRLKLTELSVELGRNPLEIRAVQTRVELEGNWEIVPKLVTFQSLGIDFTVIRFGNEWQVRPSILGTVEVAGGRLTSLFDVSNQSYYCVLGKDQKVDLKRLFTEAIGRPDLLPEQVTAGQDRLDLTTFVISGSPSASRYTLDIGTSIDMPIDLGSAKVNIKSLFFSLEYVGKEFSGRLGGSLEISGVTVAIAASYADSGWTFQTTVYDLPLTKLLATILGDAKLAEKLPDVTFPYIGLTVSPRTKAFRFAAAANIEWKNPFEVDGRFDCKIVLEVERAAAKSGQDPTPPVVCDIKIDGTGKLKVKDTDLRAELSVHATNQSEITAAGKLAIEPASGGEISFGLTFNTKAGSKRITATWPADKKSDNLPLDVKALCTHFGMDMTQVPDAVLPTFTGATFDYDFTASRLLLAAQTTNTKLFFLTSPGLFTQDAAGYLFGIDVLPAIKLSDLPVVGNALPKDLAIGLERLRVIVASAPVSLEKFNKLLPEGTKPLSDRSLSGGGKTSTQDELKKGFNVSAELLLGREARTLTLPPGPPAPAAPRLEGTRPAAATLAETAKWFDIDKSLGPVTLRRLGLTYEEGMVGIKFDATLQLNVLTFDLDGLGLRYGLGKPLEIFKNPEFTLDGMGLALGSGPVEIGGSLTRVRGRGRLEFDGSLLVRTAVFNLSALGSYADLDGTPSVMAYAVLLYAIGGDPAFFITGLAFGFGVNRKLRIPPIEAVQNFPLIQAALGKQSTAELSKQLRAYESPAPGSLWIAGGIKFTSYAMIESFALLSVSFGVEFEIALLGLSRLTVPPLAEPEQTIACAELAIRAVYKPSEGVFSLEGRLTSESYIFSKSCRLTGGFAFFVWFSGEHAGDFVVTLGGYHPKFVRPAHYPIVPRLGANWQVTTEFAVTAEMYFALTTSCLMAGGKLSAVYQSKSIKAWFVVYADFLIAWKPFHYTVDMGISIGIEADLGLFSIKFHLGVWLYLWGPEFAGRIDVDLTIVSFSVRFGKPETLPAPIKAKEFEETFLPGTVIASSLTGGLIREKERLRVVNAHALELTIRSKVPATEFVGSIKPSPAEAKMAPARKKLGIRPMGEQELVSKLEVRIDGLKDGDKNPDNLLVETIQIGAPDALWGPSAEQGKVRLPDAKAGTIKPETIDATAGIRISFKPRIPGGSLPPMPIEQFKYVNMLQPIPWDEGLKFADPLTAGYSPDAKPESRLAALELVASAEVTKKRQEILDVLAFESPFELNKVDLSQLAERRATYFQHDPEIVSTGGQFN